MAVPATVITDALVATLVALLDVTTKRCSPADLDRRHDAQLFGGQRRAMALTVGFAVAAEHIRHFQACVGSGSEIGRGSRSSGLVVEHTLLVAIRKYRDVVAKLRWPSRS